MCSSDLNGILGYRLSSYFDVSIAGSMAVMTGIVFVVVFMFAPKKGLLTIIRRRKYQKFEFAGKTLLFHVVHHEGDADESIELGVNTIQDHVNWDKAFLNKIMNQLKKENKLYIEDGIVRLTDEGRTFAKKTYEEIASGS